MTEEEKVQNAWALLVAGSVTTATTLSGLIFRLGLNREIYDILTSGIRGAFSKEEQITIKTTAFLQYLHTCGGNSTAVIFRRLRARALHPQRRKIIGLLFGIHEG